MGVNRYWRLNETPVGTDFEAALSLEEEPVPDPGEGEVLIKNDWLSMDAGTRLWMTRREDGYQPPLPLGSKMVGLGLGRVVASRAPSAKEGDLVRCFGQWADHSLVRPEYSDLRTLTDDSGDLLEHFGVLGMNAWTALAGICEVGAAKQGETVLISAAAGATGLLACQIAKIQGCIVIGIAGGAAKKRFLLDDIGLDGAIDYKSENVADALARLRGGVDVYFDNVGGPLLDDVLPNMAHYGRIAICGLISSYDGDASRPGPAHFDQILMRRLSVTGFFSPDFSSRGEEFNAKLRQWSDAGRLRMWFDKTQGLENVLSAYAKLFTGENIGKVVVDIREKP